MVSWPRLSLARSISYADLLLARQLLPAADSGAYAVGAVLAKGALWAPQVVTLLVLPRLARGDRRARVVALGLILVCGAALVAAAAVGGEVAFHLAGGTDYRHLAGSAPLFAATGALYAVVSTIGWRPPPGGRPCRCGWRRPCWRWQPP
ncbi:hypothetical protein [Micromonospora craniellae]|uniref:hypothetical protein n=1 Tax=Micromonospora craniellae TaxID=2294034 RepID=UPI00168BD27E|nr:hypothetical protein ID554_16440 [Micromonospora craniellae]